MEEVGWLTPTSIFILLFLFLSKLMLKRKPKRRNLPPSPPALPVIGHLHLIKEPLHRSLNKLTKVWPHDISPTWNTQVLVVSSPSEVEECFTKNDTTFANRPYTLAGKHLNYNRKTIGSASYGDNWRNLRRLTTLELFSSNRLAMFTRIREEEVQLLGKQLFEECIGQKAKVDFRPRFVELSFNIILRMISRKRYYGTDSVAQEGKEFQILMKEFAELQGSGNLNDFFPTLQWADFQGVKKKMLKLMKKILLDDHQKTGTWVQEKTKVI